MDWGIVYKRGTGFLCERIGDQTLLLPYRDGVANLSDVFVLDSEVAARIWDLLDGTRPLEEVRKVISEEFEAPEEVISEDLVVFVEDLARIGGVVTA